MSALAYFLVFLKSKITFKIKCNCKKAASECWVMSGFVAVLLLASVSRFRLWNSTMRVCRGTTSCVAVEGNPIPVSAATSTYQGRFRSWVWLVLLV